MNRTILVFALCSLATAQPERTPLVDRVGATGFLQVEAGSFQRLTPKERELAYWLSQASIAIDPIIYDQVSRFGLRQKRVLDAIAAHPAGVGPAALDKIMAFTKLFWANKGNHNDTTAQKFLPDFTFDELKSAALQARSHGALHEFATDAALVKELEGLRPSLFDANFEPMITAKSPQGGPDILQASANTFYSNVRLIDLKNFQEHYSLNSRLVKTADGSLVE